MKREDTFGTRLRHYRQMARLSQDSFADEMKVRHLVAPSQRDLSRYEEGKAFPRLEKLAAIVDVLGLTQHEVMGLVRLAERRRSGV